MVGGEGGEGGKGPKKNPLGVGPPRCLEAPRSCTPDPPSLAAATRSSVIFVQLHLVLREVTACQNFEWLLKRLSQNGTCGQVVKQELPWATNNLMQAMFEICANEFVHTNGLYMYGHIKKNIYIYIYIYTYEHTKTCARLYIWPHPRPHGSNELELLHPQLLFLPKMI